MPSIVRDLFEKEFADYVKVNDVVAVNSGTSALIAALCSVGFRPGDEVITTPFTFMATTSAIIIAGAKPVFVDIDPINHLIDVDKIESAINEKTRAIVPVHLFGRACNMYAILEIAARHGLCVIEDNAQSFGVKLGNKYLGTYGDAGCFSFYKTKNMSTFEGGMIAVKENSKLDVDKIRKISNPTFNKPDFKYLGYNFRMPEPCALIGLERIKLHKKSITAEIGSYSELDGFYPYLTYQTECCKELGIKGNCPVAESVVSKIRNE